MPGQVGSGGVRPPAVSHGEVTQAKRGFRTPVSSRLSSLESAESVASQAAREAALRGVWSILEDLLKALLEALRLMLDPAPLGSYDLSFNDSFITGRLALHRVRAEHLRDTKFHVKLLNPFTLCSQVQVELPWLTLKTYYDADLYLGDGSGEPMRIFGAGLAQVDLHNAQLTTKVCLEIKKFSIQVADMKISLEKAEVDLPGLFGGGAISEMISGIATDVLPGAIQEYEPEITQLAMKYINEFLRHILHRGSLKTAKG